MPRKHCRRIGVRARVRVRVMKCQKGARGYWTGHHEGHWTGHHEGQCQKGARGYCRVEYGLGFLVRATFMVRVRDRLKDTARVRGGVGTGQDTMRGTRS